jgi:serine/threonine-protein kinase
MDIAKRILELAQARGWVPPGLASADGASPGFEALGLTEKQVEELAREALQMAALDGDTACPEAWSHQAAGAFPAEAPGLPQSTRFEQATLIARGGTADVFRAFDTTLHRFVAIKVLRGSGGGARDVVLREARAQAQVEHPNVCRIYEVGAIGSQPFIAMQLVEGDTLSRIRLELGATERLRVLRDVAEGMAAAHARGLIHLDLKPGNILMERLGEGGFRPLVTDFGLYLSEGGGAEEVLRQRWLPIGTPPYCSPEQLARDWAAIDRRSDVYSLGVTLYMLLTGQSPFVETEPDALHEAILSGRVLRLRQRTPELAPDLEAIVHRAMALKVADRYDTARNLAADLDRFLKGEPVTANTSGLLYATRKWILRNRLLTAALGLAVLALLGSALWIAWHSHRTREWARLSVHYERLLQDTQFSMLDLAKPLHDTRASRDTAMGMIVEAEQSLGKEGAFARGPLHLALGRLYLEQGFLEKAQLHLEASLRSGFGAQDTEVYLGMTLLMRYFTELGDCSLVPEAERSRRVATAVLQFKEPALRCLRHSRQGRPGGTVAQICQAVLEERVEAARATLDAWRAQDPSADVYSALIVLGMNAQVSLEQARSQPEAVLAALRFRQEYAENVLKATPSQAAAYAELAECYVLRASLFQAHSREGEVLLREAVRQAAAGLVSEPDNPQILLMMAQAQAALADNLAARRLDAASEQDSATGYARQTLDLLPRWEGFFGPETTRMMHRDAMDILNTLKR